MSGIRTHLVSLRTQVRRLVDESTAEFWTDTDVDESLELGFLEVWNEVVSRGQDWSVRTSNISVVSGTELYDLPDNVMRMRRVSRANTDGTFTKIPPLRSLNSTFGTGGTNLSTSSAGVRFYIEGSQIGFRPKPTAAFTVQLVYIPNHVSMVTGTASAGGSSTITLASGSDGRDDYYVGAEITIVSGTGAGQTRRISDYVGSTLVATVGSAWTTTPDSTSVYATHPLVPDLCLKWALLESCSLLEIKDKSTRGEILAERERSRKIAVRLLRLRQTQEPMRIRMVDPDNYV